MEWDRAGKISVNRFDTVAIDTRAWVTLKEDERLYFGIYDFGKQFNESFIAKEATRDNPNIAFSEEETKYKPARYRYQVKVQNSAGDIRTVKGETIFEVKR